MGRRHTRPHRLTVRARASYHGNRFLGIPGGRWDSPLQHRTGRCSIARGRAQPQQLHKNMHTCTYTHHVPAAAILQRPGPVGRNFATPRPPHNFARPLAMLRGGLAKLRHPSQLCNTPSQFCNNTPCRNFATSRRNFATPRPPRNFARPPRNFATPRRNFATTHPVAILQHAVARRIPHQIRCRYHRVP